MTKKRSPKTTEDYFENGKLPPQAVDLEEVILGALLLEQDCYYEIADILTEELFYKEQHGKVAKAIINLKDNGNKVDILTVTQELKRTGDLEMVGGAYFVSSLTNRVASSANIEFHARLLQEKYALRETIRSSTELIRGAYQDAADFSDVIGKWESDLQHLTDKLFMTKTTSLKQLDEHLLRDNSIMNSNSTAVVGVPTGYSEMDIVTGGWQPSDLIILAARPGMGKTALMLCYARNTALQGLPVALFSLEMSALQLYKRMVSQETWIPLEQLTKVGMDPATEALYNKEKAKLLAMPLHIDDSPNLNIFDLKSKCRKLKREKKIKLIIIDYIQLMSGVGNFSGNREQEVSQISRSLKLLAKELEIPIIALSQLSRQVENRPGGGKKPQLSDLRDSGSIEQDADMVQFIYRPEYYGMQVNDKNESVVGKAEVIIAKNRHGATTDVSLRWVGSNVLFLDIDDNRTVLPSTDQLGQLFTNNNFLNKEDENEFEF